MHISKRHCSSYQSSEPVVLFNEAEQLGYGNVSEQTSSNECRKSVFHKRRYEELSEDCETKLKRAKVSREKYDK